VVSRLIQRVNTDKSQEGFPMAQCEVCGNEYDKAFEVRLAGQSHTFDSFECAIQALAPTCAHCGSRPGSERYGIGPEFLKRVTGF
jgi:hypothetical protein